MDQGSRSHPVPSRSTDKLPHLRHTTDPRPHQISHTFSGKLLASVPSHIFYHTSCLNRTPGFPSPFPLSGSKSPTPIRPLSLLWARTLPLSKSSVPSEAAIPYGMFTQPQSQKHCKL